jgi:hypothetical protein
MSLDGGWVHPENSVDVFKAGDPETEVEGIAVAWMSYLWALREADRLGCNLFIAHEPIYYCHQGLDMDIFDLPVAREKRNYLDVGWMVVLRCHDFWDQYPGM